MLYHALKKGILGTLWSASAIKIAQDENLLLLQCKEIYIYFKLSVQCHKYKPLGGPPVIQKQL